VYQIRFLLYNASQDNHTNVVRHTVDILA